MKKFLAILAVIALGVASQACGGSEKCPAYSKADTPAESRV